MQIPIIFDFKKKAVTSASDPSLGRKLREVLAGRRHTTMTGPGTPKITRR